MKNKKESKKTNFNYSEEFITKSSNTNKQELKNIFNTKYFNYIKRIERRNYKGDTFE